MHLHRPARLIAATLLVVGAGCASSNGSRSGADASGTTAASSVAVEANDSDVAIRAREVIDLINAEATDLVVTELEFGFWEDAGSLPAGTNRWYVCDRRVRLFSTTAAELPASLGDSVLDGVYVPYLQARRSHAESLQGVCDELAGTRDAISAGDAAPIPAVLFESNGDVLDACFAAIDAFSPFGVLNCEGIPSQEGGGPFIDHPPSELFAALGVDPNWRDQLDASPESAGACAETGGLASERTRLGPGTEECLWFARPFVFELSTGVLMQSTSDAMAFVPLEDGHTLYLWALDGLADPSALGEFPPSTTIPFPEDLSDWWAQLPVDILETEVSELGGIPVTRWIVRGLRDEMIAAAGDQVVQLAAVPSGRDGPQIQGGVMDAPPDLPEDQRGAPVFNEEPIDAFWHIDTPTGPVLAQMFTFTEFGPELEWATEVIDAINFVQP